MRDIDQIIMGIKQQLPEVQWEQLQVLHPGVDDDGLWFFWIPNRNRKWELQIESPYGACPFIIESFETETRGDTVPETISLIVDLLLNAKPV
jgi:hypothetical protein